jgi:hypothetical protein
MNRYEDRCDNRYGRGGRGRRDGFGGGNKNYSAGFQGATAARGREATMEAGAREADVSTSGSGFRIQREKNFDGVFIEIAIATDLSSMYYCKKT